MGLTPADVHNVAFSKPPIGKRGYNEDEVDAFLDLVEAELARLVEENNDLRSQVEQLESQLQTAQVDLDDARSQAAQVSAAPAPVEEPRRLRRSRRRPLLSRRRRVAIITCRPPRCSASRRRWPTA